MKKSLYDILELSRLASAEAVQAAYERLSSALTPKVEAGDDDARTRLVGVREAYSTLSDPAKRALYDVRLAAALQPAPEPEMIDVPEDADKRKLWLYAGAAMVLLTLAFGSVRMYTNHQAQMERERLQKLEALERERLRIEEQRLQAQREAEARRVGAAEQAIDRSFSRQEQMDSERQRRQLESDRLQLERQKQLENRQKDMQARQSQREEQMARERERVEAERRLRAEKDLLRQTCMQRYGRPDC